MLNGYEAKRLGREVDLVPDWDEHKDQIMLEIIRAKFLQHDDLRCKLVSTGNELLVEDNTWGDYYWGRCNGKGLNKLGEILMLVRKELRMNEISVALTGHRPSAMAEKYGYNYNNEAWAALSDAFERVIKALSKKHGAVTLYDGMALGVDQAMALRFLKIREEISGKLVACIPCRNQDKKWFGSSKTLYHDILTKADESVLVTDTEYTARCMQVRNEYMVDHADVIVAVWSGKQYGGTFNAVSYARQQNKPVIYINPDTLEVRMLTS